MCTAAAAACSSMYGVLFLSCESDTALIGAILFEFSSLYQEDRRRLMRIGAALEELLVSFFEKWSKKVGRQVQRVCY